MPKYDPERKTVKQLREFAKRNNLKGYSRLNKTQLIILIKLFLKKKNSNKIGQSKKGKFIYRNTTSKWLKSFLENKMIYPSNNYISFSFLENSGVKNKDFGNIRIIFNANKLFNQGAKPIDYNMIDEEIALHLAGIGKEELRRLSQRDIDYFVDELDISTYEKEQEIIIPKLKYEKDLIIKVILPKESLSNLKSLLEKNNIEYKVSD